MSFIVYAHRGASEYTPENTLLSFYTGVYMGANGIETDVQRTRDGHLVLFHDDTLTRVTGKDGAVADYTLAELRGFLVRRGELADRIVTLSEFLERFLHFPLTYAIELKVRDTEADVLAHLRAFGSESRTVVTSFDYENLCRMRALAPQLRCGYLVERADAATLSDMLSRGITEICPRATTLDEAEIARYRAAGMQSIRAWGVADDSLMRRVYDLGCDGATVNFPDRMVGYVRGRRSEGIRSLF